MYRKLLFTLALAASAAQAQAQAPANAAADGDEYLLFQTKDDGGVYSHRTLWVKVSAQGAQVLGEFADPMVAAGDKIFAVEQVASEYKSYDCDKALEASNAEDPKSVKLEAITTKYTRTALRDVTTPGAKAIWTSPAAKFNLQAEDPMDGCGSFENSGAFSAIAGPYVSLVSCDNAFLGGPHGSVTCESHTFDLTKGTERNVKSDGTFTMPTDAEKKALKWMFGDTDPITDGKAQYANWISKYGASGLEVSLLMIHETSYAASSPEWSSEYTTAFFPQKKLPKDFAPYKDLPKGLEKFASTNNQTLIGFSKIQKTDAVSRYLSAHAKPAK